MLIRLLRPRLAPHRGAIALLVLLHLAQTAANLYLPALNARVIDNGVVTGDTDYILRTGGVLLLVTVAQVAVAITATYAGARTAIALGRDLRAAVFARVLGFSAREVARFGTPSLLTRTTNDVQQVQALALVTLTLVVSAPIICVGGIVLAVRVDVPLSALLLVIVPVLAVVVILLVGRMRPGFRTVQGRVDGLTRVLREQVTGIRVIRAFVREGYERDRFAAASTDLMTASVGVGRVLALMGPAVLLVTNLSTVAALWFGALRVDSGSVRIGALTAFVAYLTQVLISVVMATFLFMVVPRAEVCAERIQEVLDTESSVAPATAPAPTTPRQRPSQRTDCEPPADARLELRDVTLRYPGAEAPVLSHVDVTARPGETTAIVGSTGSGKSTLLSLVPRLMDVTGGAVLVGGVNVRDLAADTLTATVGLVPQQAYLFSGTVASNLRYGRPDATDAELWHALDVAQARDFVERLPERLSTPVAQGGTNVSGGQRQRLAIARALVGRPRIYLFDDSFSALDAATDAALRAALARETRDSTVVIVAQRVTTTMHADSIVVLDNGRVVGTGQHSWLLATCATYRELALSQLADEETR